jgi:hypothetical protein
MKELEGQHSLERPGTCDAFENKSLTLFVFHCRLIKRDGEIMNIVKDVGRWKPMLCLIQFNRA